MFCSAYFWFTLVVRIGDSRHFLQSADELRPVPSEPGFSVKVSIVLCHCLRHRPGTHACICK
jgi:hypothetical protein